VLPPAPVSRSQLEDLASYIAEVLPRYVQVAQITPMGELELLVAPSAVTPVLTFLRDDARCLFKSLADLCGVDIPKREKRFEVRTHV
jgi:NADH:ubiquinone oxidoreductase subunit C